MDRDDLGAIDVDLAEDLAQGFFAQLIGYRRVAPQRPELPQDVPRAPEPELVGRRRGDLCRPIQPAPCPAERLDAARLATEAIERQLATARMAHELVQSRLRSLDPKDLTPSAAARLWEVAARLEREALDLRAAADRDAGADLATGDEAPDAEVDSALSIREYMHANPEKIGPIVVLLEQLQVITGSR